MIWRPQFPRRTPSAPPKGFRRYVLSWPRFRASLLLRKGKELAFYTKEAVQNRLKAGKMKPESRTGLTYEGKEIILEKQTGYNPAARGVRMGTLKRSKKHYPEAKKIEAATLYAALGNVYRVAELTGVPYGTCKKWSQEDWWYATLARVKRENLDEMDAKTTKIIDKALDKLMERIDGGDYIYDMKTGRTVPIPMSGRDLAIVTGTIFDKRQLLRGEATKITHAVASDDHLKMLADKFVQFVEEKQSKQLPKTIDIVDAELVPDETNQ